jgi:predicted transcriptional regulator/N-acetylglutamate synthase-like GNAT family acetyltransferase
MNKNALSQIAVHRLTQVDSKTQSDRWRTFTEFVLQNEEMYPAIEAWLNSKVAPQLGGANRRAFLLSDGEKPIASVVLKRGESSKLCHVRIDPSFQNRNLGTLLFCLLAHEIRSLANEVHFTLPETLWLEKEEFFRSFGFAESTVANQQYRLFDRELSCSAPFQTFWKQAEDQLPAIAQFLGTIGYVDVPRLLMSIRPKFARAIVAGDKSVEIRRSFSSRWIDQRICIYSSAPDRCLLGEATVLSVITGHPEEIWSSYRAQMGCSRTEFDDYARGKSRLAAIELGQATRYERPLPLSELRALNQGRFSPPQSYRAVREGDNFHSLLSVAHDLCMGPLALPTTR